MNDPSLSQAMGSNLNSDWSIQKNPDEIPANEELNLDLPVIKPRD